MYFSACRIEKPAPGISVATIEPATPEPGFVAFDDVDLERASFPAPEDGIAWLISRGCEEAEARRIVATAVREISSSSTGSGPTKSELILSGSIGIGDDPDA
jgi:hypothetical protein